jgi:DNA-binding GntR family transcriptional regulator
MLCPDRHLTVDRFQEKAPGWVLTSRHPAATLLVYGIPTLDEQPSATGLWTHLEVVVPLAAITQTPASDARPLHRTTLAEQVYQRIRQQILDNAYPPHAALPEKTLALQLEVSRVPVREALHRLAAEGLVTLRPRRGAFVNALSARQFLDAYRVREALEDLAIKLALPHLTPDDLDALGRLQDEMRRHAASDDADAFFAANHAFHALFVERSQNAYLQGIYFPLMDQMRRHISSSLGLRGGLARSIEEHQAILGAIQSGDADEAARLLREHIHVPQRALEEGEPAREREEP